MCILHPSSLGNWSSYIPQHKVLSVLLSWGGSLLYVCIEHNDEMTLFHFQYTVLLICHGIFSQYTRHLQYERVISYMNRSAMTRQSLCWNDHHPRLIYAFGPIWVSGKKYRLLAPDSHKPLPWHTTITHKFDRLHNDAERHALPDICLHDLALNTSELPTILRWWEAPRPSQPRNVLDWG